MTSQHARKVSVEELQKVHEVHNLIEQCLRYYLTLAQVVDILHQQHKIEPTFTKIVWKQLEEENQEFFKGYYLRMRLKQQIIDYNSLLDKQAALMCQVGPSRVASQPMPNGYNMPTMHYNTSCYVPKNTNNIMKTDNTQHHVKTSLPNGFNNYGPLIHSGADTSARYSPDIVLAQNSNLGMNRPVIKTEPGYLDDSRYVYGPSGNSIGGASVFLDDSSFEPSGLISQSIGFPELAAGSTNDIVLAQKSNLGMNGPVIKTEPGYLDDSRYVYGPGGNLIGGASVFLDDSLFERSGLISQRLGFPELAAGFTNGENKRLDATSKNLDLHDFGIHI